MIARDAGSNVVPNAQIVLDFRDCSDVRVCRDQPLGAIADCASRTVRKFTNGGGQATFIVWGAGLNRGAEPGAGPDCLAIYGDGVLLSRATVNVWDQNGAMAGGLPGVEVTDLSAWLRDFGTGAYFGRSDYDLDGTLGVADFQRLIEVFGTGASSEGCTSPCLE